MRTLRLSLLALLLASGCVSGGAEGADSYSTGLIEVTPGTLPLAPIEAEAWQAAPAGCEDRLMGEISFKIASADDGLVAAVDGEGTVVCVDTVESVQEELHEQGDDERADALDDQFLLAAGMADIPDGDYAGDPTPQPSTDFGADPGDGTNEDDPSPQPSMQPRR